MTSAIFAEAAILWRQMSEEYDAAKEAAYRLAEHETNGVLVNKAGRAQHVSGYSLFSGPEDRARKHASEELLDHWIRHPRPNKEHFERQWISGRRAWQ